VSQRAEETLKLAMPQNMRYAPIRRAVPSSGLDSPDCERERTMGKSTPPLAVLLGKAGADDSVGEEDAVRQPSVDRRRAPRHVAQAATQPDFTTPRATRKRDHHEEDGPVGEPPERLRGATVPVSTAAASAIMAPSGAECVQDHGEDRGPEDGEECHALGVSPSGTGVNQKSERDGQGDPPDKELARGTGQAGSWAGLAESPGAP